jgi:signal transduction histidine kinase
VSLPEMVARLQPTMSGLAAGAAVQLDVQLEPGLPVLSTDERRVSQVLLNLVDNAIKYTPGGGHVELRAARSGDGVAFAVSDTGIGIPDEFKDALFRPFSRVPGAAPQRGQASSGLGLALSRQILDALGASISVADRPGGGTVFTVQLPLSAEETARVVGTDGADAMPGCTAAPAR